MEWLKGHKELGEWKQMYVYASELWNGGPQRVLRQGRSRSSLDLHEKKSSYVNDEALPLKRSECARDSFESPKVSPVCTQMEINALCAAKK
jgi:hypothetical protein